MTLCMCGGCAFMFMIDNHSSRTCHSGFQSNGYGNGQMRSGFMNDNPSLSAQGSSYGSDGYSRGGDRGRSSDNGGGGGGGYGQR